MSDLQVAFDCLVAKGYDPPRCFAALAARKLVAWLLERIDGLEADR